jgi:hypothetical protein
MKEVKKKLDKEESKLETNNEKEMKTGKNDSPDLNGVGSNEENEAPDEGLHKVSEKSDESGTFFRERK